MASKISCALTFFWSDYLYSMTQNMLTAAASTATVVASGDTIFPTLLQKSKILSWP